MLIGQTTNLESIRPEDRLKPGFQGWALSYHPVLLQVGQDLTTPITMDAVVNEAFPEGFLATMVVSMDGDGAARASRPTISSN